MPFVIKSMKLNKAELLSVVDKGASGDDENRPSIVLFKRKKDTMPKQEELPLAKMEGLSSIVAAIDELGLSDEQKAGVLKLLESVKAPAAAEPAPEAPAAPPEEMSEEAAEKMAGEEDEEMNKRHKEEVATLQKRVRELEDAAQMVKLEKRAGELKFLPLEKSKVISLLKRVGDDADVQEMLTKLAKASEESPILRAAGVVSRDSDGGEAVKTLEKRVKSMLDADPTMKREDAKSAVLANDNKLYKEYLAEMRG